MKILNLLVPIRFEEFISKEKAMLVKGFLFFASLIVILFKSADISIEVCTVEPQTTLSEVFLLIIWNILLLLSVYFVVVYLIGFVVSSLVIKKENTDVFSGENEFKPPFRPDEERMEQKPPLIPEEQEEYQTPMVRDADQIGERGKDNSFFISNSIDEQAFISLLKENSKLLGGSKYLSMTYYVLLDKGCIVENQRRFLNYVSQYINIVSPSTFNASYNKMLDSLREEEAAGMNQDYTAPSPKLNLYEQILVKLQPIFLD